LFVAFLDGDRAAELNDTSPSTQQQSCRRSKRLCRSPLQLFGEAVQRRAERWDSLSIQLIGLGCGSSASPLTTPNFRKLLSAAVPVEIDTVGIVSESSLLMECVKARTASEAVILSCVRELVEQHGADVNRANRCGMSVLIISAARGLPGVVKYLLTKKADTSVQGTGRFVTYVGTKAKPVRGTMTALEWARAMSEAERTFQTGAASSAASRSFTASLPDCIAALAAAGRC